MEHPSALKRFLRDRIDSDSVCLQYTELSGLVRRNLTAVIGWVLNFSKYDGTLSFADTQAGSAVFAIKLLFIAVPFVVGVLNIILLRFYKLDKMYPQIIEDLNKRNGK